MTRFMRQEGFAPSEKLQAQEVWIIGLGGIGSAVGLCLSKMGIGFINGCDADEVADHNLSNQMFPASSLGQLKAEAFEETLKAWGNSVEVMASCEMYEGQYEPKGIVIMGPDTIGARKKIFRHLKKRPTVFGIDWIIDGRMGAQTARIFTFQPNNRSHADAYLRSLPDPDKVMEAPCTERAIAYTTWMIAAHVGKIVQRIATEDQPQLPFQLVHDMVTQTLLKMDLEGNATA
tara:strand:- start:93 stop:788 length:696 start_codon:yes stop_codon:yes gene_type:complete